MFFLCVKHTLFTAKKPNIIDELHPENKLTNNFLTSSR